MFRCDNCNNVTTKGEPMTRRVVKKRDRVYLGLAGSVVGRGWEIVKELGLCPRCVEKSND
jgi:hypothetical protein